MSALSRTWVSTHSGPFHVHIEGLPINYTWQNLKDLIRHEAWHGVWTVVSPYPNAQGSGKGYARVERPCEAENLCNFLDKRGLNVHLWNIPAEEATFIRCNCPNAPRSHVFSDVTFTGLRYVARDISSLERPHNPPLTQAGSVYPRQNVQYAQTGQIQARPIQQLPLQQGTQPIYGNSVPPMRSQTTRPQVVYTSPSTRLPVNINQGYVRIEYRGIFVSGLNFRAQKHEIQDHFAKAGTIVKCERQKNSSGEFNGVAVIQYSSTQEANNAIEKFNGKKWNGRKLIVRQDREGTAVTAPSAASSSQHDAGQLGSPIIVNGSSGNPQVRQEWFESDSNSMDSC